MLREEEAAVEPPEEPSEQTSPGWWVYVLRCCDDSLYVGVTTDRERRLHEHNHTARGARYTRARRPVQLVRSWPFEGRSEAQQAEAAFRKLSRRQKLRRLDEQVTATPPAPSEAPAE